MNHQGSHLEEYQSNFQDQSNSDIFSLTALKTGSIYWHPPPPWTIFDLFLCNVIMWSINCIRLTSESNKWTDENQQEASLCCLPSPLSQPSVSPDNMDNTGERRLISSRSHSHHCQHMLMRLMRRDPPSMRRLFPGLC